MSKVQIRYDILIQDAFRNVIRSILVDVSKVGLRGDHHYFIRIDCTKPDVIISDTLRKEYPNEIVIVLQHQFWDLIVKDKTFEVTLQFAGVAEKLIIPFHAIKGFNDPSVNFSLEFDVRSGGKAATDKPATANNVTQLNRSNKVTHIGNSQNVRQIRKTSDVLHFGETKPAQITTIRTKPKLEDAAVKPKKRGAKSTPKKTKSAKPATRNTKGASATSKSRSKKSVKEVESKENLVEAKVVSLDNFRNKT